MRVAALGAAALLLAGCGAVHTGMGSNASGTRTASPPAPSQSPNAVLGPGNCTGSSPSSNSTTTKPLGPDSITLKIPIGWSDHTSEVTGIAAVLYIEAPASYGADNATLMFVVIPGPRPGSSAHEQATDDATGLAPRGPLSVVNDCIVGAEKASFYQYQDSAGNDVYRLLILHSPTSRYPFLYAVEVSSRGQIDDRAKADVRAILGSWTWGIPVYDPNV
jgi:hypothetical protein